VFSRLLGAYHTATVMIAEPRAKGGDAVGSRLVAFPVAENQTILVEVDDPDVGNQPVARGVAERAQETFETAIAQIRLAERRHLARHRGDATSSARSVGAADRLALSQSAARSPLLKNQFRLG
jgi:hypothetical protein